MGLFLSTYVNKLDKKGRISVPAPFRSVINSSTKSIGDFQGIIAYPSFINKCIEASGIDRMEKISESIDRLDPYSDQRDAFATAILGGSIQMPFDADGRVTLPEPLIKVAAIKDNAIFVGKGATFEIWNPADFEEYFNKSREIAAKNRGALSLKGGGNNE